MDLYKVTTEKLKELKTWAQVRSPKTLQPALSYALDWLAPELLGTGFRMLEISDFSIKACVPARPTNFDFNKQIHQGLVVNAGFELVRAFLQKQMADSIFQVTSSDISLIKKQNWNNDLEIVLETDQSVMDDFFIDLQKKKKTEIVFDFKIKIADSKKFDSMRIAQVIEKTELIG
jgi:hypothetical protein